jgi:adenylate cyclase
MGDYGMMKNTLNKRKKLIGDIIILIILILGFLFDLLAFFEYKLQDSAFQRPERNELPAPYITVFGIDSDTLEAFDNYGRFQDWNRQKIADAINILNRYEDAKPAVIAIDILYTSESSNPEADAALAQAVSDGGNVVLASLARYGYIWLDRDNLKTERAVTGHEIPFPALAQNSAYGIVNADPSRVDSLMRYAVLKQEYSGGYIYSFPAEIYKKYMEYMWDENSVTDNFINAHNTAYITYYGLPDTYSPESVAGTRLSFLDIFDEDFEPDWYADEIILIGPYAPGFEDAYFTPVSRGQMYGVEIHANVVNMLIDGNFKRYIPRAINFAVLIFFILVTLVLAKFTDMRILLGVLAALGAGYYFAALYIFRNGYILSLLYPLFSLAALYIYQVVYGYILETFEKRKLKSAFKKYVDPKLVDKLIEGREADSNEVGVKKNIAVMFVDVRGFTPMTEALKDNPELVVKILNEYLELTSSAVFDNDGSVDKFVGDATMALFNGFFHTENYVYKAVKAAWDMVQGASAVNAALQEKYGVDVGFGIGINCGDAIVGNLGPSFRKDYTAIGDTVNTAARLESNAKSSQILISSEVYEVVKEQVDADSVGAIPLKGKSIELEVFSVTNVRDC